MKPQDLAIALLLSQELPPETFAELARSAGLSTSEAHGSVGRLKLAGLVDQQRQANRARLLDFLLHGLRYTFPAQPSEMSLGVPTGAAHFPPDSGLPTAELPWVWPSAQGSARGLALKPLYRGALRIVERTPWLHEMLALLDLLRAGRARERNWARRALKRRLADPGAAQTWETIDPGTPQALHDMFSHARLMRSVRKRIGAPNRELGGHPWGPVVLTALGKQIIAELAREVPTLKYEGEEADRLSFAKERGGTHELVYPSLLDSIVSGHIVDELEPLLRRAEQGRVFMARSRVPASSARGSYDGPWLSEWRSFVSSLERIEGKALAIRTDLRSFFPSIRPTLAAQLLAQRTGAGHKVLAVLMSCQRAWSPECTGLPIDNQDVSRLLAHALMRPVDECFEDSAELSYRRFADDTVIFADSEEQLRQAKERFERELGTLGLKMNHEKTERGPVDLIRRHFTSPLAGSLRAARNTSTLVELYKKYECSERSALRARRQILTVASRGANQALVPVAAKDLVRSSGIREAGLRFLASQSLKCADLTPLLSSAEEWCEYSRVGLVDALSRARLSRKARVLIKNWGRVRLNHADCSDMETGRLLLLLFKLTAQVDPLAAQWRPRSSSSQVITDALCLLDGSLPEIRDSSSDRFWGRSLLERVIRGKLKVNQKQRLLLRKAHDGWAAEPEHLPLLHLIAQHCPTDCTPWLKLLEASKDPAMRMHALRMRERA